MSYGVDIKYATIKSDKKPQPQPEHKTPNTKHRKYYKNLLIKMKCQANI